MRGPPWENSGAALKRYRRARESRHPGALCLADRAGYGSDCRRQGRHHRPLRQKQPEAGQRDRTGEKVGRMGIPAAIGTDSAASNNALDMFEEMRTASLLAKGIDRDPLALPAAKTLYMATRAGALSQGRETAGDIVPGYQADLVLVDLETPSMTPCHSAVSNLVYAANGGAVRMTMVDGRILYRDGRFPHPRYR